MLHQKKKSKKNAYKSIAGIYNELLNPTNPHCSPLVTSVLKASRAYLTDKQLYNPDVNTMDRSLKKKKKIRSEFNNGNRHSSIKGINK